MRKSFKIAIRKISKTKWNVASVDVLSGCVNAVTSDVRRQDGTDDLGKISSTHWMKFSTNGVKDTSSVVTATSILEHQD
jgi:hypothetical protein